MKKKTKQTKKQILDHTKNKLIHYSQNPINKTLNEFATSLEGLSSKSIPQLQEKYGKNLLGNKHKYRW